MRRELDEKLCKDFPEIFRDREKHPSETAMCFGFPGDGWYHLIHSLCTLIQSYVDRGGVEQITAFQVKEKFGTLRFYIWGGDEYVEGLISMAEQASSHICEKCGNLGKQRYRRGWTITLCEECAEKEDAEIWELSKEQDGTN